MKRAERHEYWQGHIEGCAKSGLTKVGYCLKHGINRNSLRTWERRLELPAVAKTPGAFVALRTESTEARVSAVRFTLPGGIEFTSPGYPDPAWLRSVMGVRG